MPAESPIGVFDSGLGGLTVVKALRRVLPRESMVYLGDTARVPYGNKSQDLIQAYTLEIARFLVEKGSKLIVVACNTASSLALDTLQEVHSLPVVGVIEPGVEAALGATRNGHIGVIGTLATINSGAYARALTRDRDSVVVISQPCPLLVPLAEEGWLEGEVPRQVVSTYLESLTRRGIDTLILGCTHYPLLKPLIASQLDRGTTLVDSAEAVARQVKEALQDRNLETRRTTPGKLECYVTDLPIRFGTVAGRFLGRPVEHVARIQLA